MRRCPWGAAPTSWASARSAHIRNRSLLRSSAIACPPAAGMVRWIGSIVAAPELPPIGPNGTSEPRDTRWKACLYGVGVFAGVSLAAWLVVRVTDGVLLVTGARVIATSELGAVRRSRPHRAGPPLAPHP